MALFIDGEISNPSDLTVHDSSLLEVTTTERIDLALKLQLAQSEIQEALSAFLNTHAPARCVEGVVLNSGIRRWHQMKTLELTYRDAFFSQLNDRYEKRWQLWVACADKAQRDVFEVGVPYHDFPIRRPDSPALIVHDGSCLPATYFIRTSWVNQDGEQSAAGPASTIELDAPHRLVVRSGAPAPNCTGWLVFAGSASGEERLQTQTSIPFADDWVVPPDGLHDGALPGQGQKPTTIIQRRRTILRG